METNPSLESLIPPLPNLLETVNSNAFSFLVDSSIPTARLRQSQSKIPLQFGKSGKSITIPVRRPDVLTRP